MTETIYLTHFNSTLDLSTRSTDLLHVYVIPTITGFIFLIKITSSVAIISIIRNKKKMKNMVKIFVYHFQINYKIK